MSNQPYLRFNLNAGPLGRRPSSAQLADLIREQLASKHLPPGCRIPPVRVLAHQLSISKNTVQRAYDALVAQGLLLNKKRVGLFLAQQQKEVPPHPKSTAAPLALTEIPGFRIDPRDRDLAYSKGRIYLSGATIDPELLPSEKFSACLRTALKDRKGLLASYPDVQGFPPLRKKIAERLQRRGIPARAEDVVMCLGSQQTLDLVCKIMARRRIAVENPAYQIGKQLFEMNAAKLVGLPLDPFTGPDIDVWERRLARARPGLLYLVPTFQNPTGYTYQTGELERIIELSTRYNFGLLEDDWGSEMLSFSEFRPTLRARAGENVLYVNSFTKKLLPSMRLGYIVGNEDTTPALTLAKRNTLLGTPLVLEAALCEFLDLGYYDAHLKQLHPELDRRYHACLEALRQTMPDGVRWTTPGGGPLLWVELPPHIDLEVLSTRLAARNVFIHMANQSFIGTPHLNGFRLCHAAIDSKTMQRGLEILAEELKRVL